jgi:hypothetical protein
MKVDRRIVLRLHHQVHALDETPCCAFTPAGLDILDGPGHSLDWRFDCLPADAARLAHSLLGCCWRYERHNPK